MVVGVPKEVKVDEYRVAVTPAGVRALVEAGHVVLIETNSGTESGFPDDAYASEGARIVAAHSEVFAGADLIVKVKEPVRPEYPLLRRGQVLFTFLHLAADRELAGALVESGVLAIAYETVVLPDGSRPMLEPMSAIAGRLAAQEGAKYLERPQGGRGVLPGGIPGVGGARVTVIGGGVVGVNAAQVAAGMGAEVTVMELNPARLQALRPLLPGNVAVVASTPDAAAGRARASDLVIGAVLVTGARAPRVLDRAAVRGMPGRSVLLDVSIDQGGCFETSRPTTHRDPVYLEEGVLHYCVTNMPGSVPVTSTRALSNASLPYVLSLADLGAERALAADPALAGGVNVAGGRIVHPALQECFGGGV